jgi:hypothetical protein
VDEGGSEEEGGEGDVCEVSATGIARDESGLAS